LKVLRMSRLLSLSSPLCAISLIANHRDTDPSSADQNALWLGEHLTQFRPRRAKLGSASGQRHVASRRSTSR
jgi:hypothetical protein